MAKLLGAKIGDYHTLNDWGLYLKVGSPKIGAAEVDEHLVQVTGSDTLLNLTACAGLLATMPGTVTTGATATPTVAVTMCAGTTPARMAVSA